MSDKKILVIVAVIVIIMITMQGKKEMKKEAGDTNALDNPSFETQEVWIGYNYGCSHVKGEYSTEWSNSGLSSYKIYTVNDNCQTIWLKQNVDLTGVHAITYKYSGSSLGTPVRIANFGAVSCDGAAFSAILSDGIARVDIPSSQRMQKTLCLGVKVSVGDIFYVDDVKLEGSCPVETQGKIVNFRTNAVDECTSYSGMADVNNYCDGVPGGHNGIPDGLLDYRRNTWIAVNGGGSNLIGLLAYGEACGYTSYPLVGQTPDGLNVHARLDTPMKSAWLNDAQCAVYHNQGDKCPGCIPEISKTPTYPYCVNGQEVYVEAPPCNTDADTDCDGTVSDSELLSYASLWMAGSISDSSLLQAASAWLV